MKVYRREAQFQIEPGEATAGWVLHIRAVGVREVGKRAGVSYTCVSLWLGGRIKLPESSCRRIVEAAGLAWPPAQEGAA